MSNMKEFQKAPPKYKIGDLVEIGNLGMIFVQYEGATRVKYGLIQCEAYHYSNNTKDLLLFKKTFSTFQKSLYYYIRILFFGPALDFLQT